MTGRTVPVSRVGARANQRSAHERGERDQWPEGDDGLAKMGAMPRPSLLALLVGLAVVVVACGSDVVSPSPSVPAGSLPPSRESPTVAPIPSEPPPGAALWTRLSPSGPGPSAREGHTWTADPTSGLAYVFGGRDGQGALDDLWVYDLAADAWHRLRPDGPAPRARFGHAAVWVDGLGLVVFAGQARSASLLADIWAYDPDANRWRELPSPGDGPAARTGSCAAVGPDVRIWISHGALGGEMGLADTWAYDPEAHRWSDETPGDPRPVARSGHRCWWTANGRFAIYAGETTGGAALDDLWTLAAPDGPGAAWTRIEGERTIPRSLPAVDANADRIVVVGGIGTGGVYLADIVTFDATTLAARSVEQAGEAPGGRAGAALVDDPAAERLLLFGGRDRSGALDELWQLDLP